MYTFAVAKGVPTLKDTWSPDYLEPRLDTTLGGTSDAKLMSGSETGGVTQVVFQRRLNTGDSRDVIIRDADLYVLWAYAPVDSTAVKHTNFGVGTVNFLAKGAATTAAPATTGPANSQVERLVAQPPTATSSNGRFSAWWEVNGPVVTFVMRGQTSGWVSLAISNGPAMTNIDRYIQKEKEKKVPERC